MSNNSTGVTSAGAGAAGVDSIDHVTNLSEDFSNLLQSTEYSDLILKVEQTRFPVHRVVLAARSEYFRALLYGGLKESDPTCHEIELQGASSAAFQLLLKYIYTGRIKLANMKEEQLLDVLDLVHQYGFLDLEIAISEYLKANLNLRNVCMIYNIANLYNLNTLSATCLKHIDQNAKDIIQSDGFISLTENALYEIVRRDSFYANENDIFTAVCNWADNNPELPRDRVIHCVRLPLMDLDEILTKVRPTTLVSPDALLDAIQTKTKCKDMDLGYRGILVSDENVATSRHGAEVIHGEIKSALLDEDVTTYDLDRGFSRHLIDESCANPGIVVQLKEPHIINTIRLLLWDRDQRSYSYYIECSMDNKDWVCIVDHSKYFCRSWQKLHFPTRVAKYFRIVGTHNTVNRVFHAIAFECYFTYSTFVLDNGIIVPRMNVATLDCSACVLEGVSRSRNALINGDTKNYDWDSGYTCHQLGSGCIIIQLAQPYMLDSMRLLLWDCDDRRYSYTIEVSVNQQNWETVAKRENCRSWEILTFPKRPVAFVKLIGMHNTANEVFHCVHFECPADQEALNQYKQTLLTPSIDISENVKDI
ncbi:BTB/POZ domain-containing protein 9-like [Tubulanus polymorphus]|uniref:BTB/POZ domain-containing protein 9-like n=1 Tax=Tubulanus polymorphus TaxID=672921 RepID=UPI003DA581E6